LTVRALAEILRAVPACTPARKPLYLATGLRLRIIAQAESLVIQQPAKSDRRFPLARIDRVVCGSQTDWSGEALALCMANGVTITWVSGRGEVLGQCASSRRVAASREARLESFLDHPDWETRYRDWLRSRRMSVLMDWAAARAGRNAAPRAAVLERHKREYVYHAVITEVFGTEAKGWCHAWTVARLREAGLAARYWGHDASALDLADDIAGLLWAEINLAGGAIVKGASGGRDGMLFFENWTRLNGARPADHLAQLNRLVARENETWR